MLLLLLGQLSRAITFRDKASFLRLYKVYVRPHLEYAVELGTLDRGGQGGVGESPEEGCGDGDQLEEEDL